MTYVHHVPGRLRIRATITKNGAVRNALRQWLESVNGVDRVDVNAVTGSVLIYYRAGVIDGNRLLALIRDRGWIAVPSQPKPPVPSASVARQRRSRGAERVLANLVIRSVAEIAIERGLLALAAALL